MSDHNLTIIKYANIYKGNKLFPLEMLRCSKCGLLLFRNRKTGFRVYLEHKYGEEINGNCTKEEE